MKIKLECCHADTCLPDYWGGHHMAHISVPVYSGIMLGELKSLLRDEVIAGAVAGSDPRTFDEHEDYKQMYDAMLLAIEEITQKIDGPLFTEIEEQEEDPDFSVYAYFVFVELE